MYPQGRVLGPRAVDDDIENKLVQTADASLPVHLMGLPEGRSAYDACTPALDISVIELVREQGAPLASEYKPRNFLA